MSQQLSLSVWIPHKAQPLSYGVGTNSSGSLRSCPRASNSSMAQSSGSYGQSKSTWSLYRLSIGNTTVELGFLLQKTSLSPDLPANAWFSPPLVLLGILDILVQIPSTSTAQCLWWTTSPNTFCTLHYPLATDWSQVMASRREGERSRSKQLHTARSVTASSEA